MTILYIDPATTSMLIQIIAGVVVTLGVFVSIFFSKIKRLFKKDKGEENKSNENTISSNEKKIITAEDLLNDD